MDAYVLSKPVMMLAAAIILAIIVERLIEIGKSLFEFYMTKNIYKCAALKTPENVSSSIENNFWSKKAINLGKNLELRLDAAKMQMSNGGSSVFSGRNALELALKAASRYLSPANADQDGLFVISASKVRAIYLKLACKIIAIIIGVILAFLLKMDIVALVKFNLNSVSDYQTAWYGCLLTGIAIGLGSGPMHKIIVALEDRQKKRNREDD